MIGTQVLKRVADVEENKIERMILLVPLSPFEHDLKTIEFSPFWITHLPKFKWKETEEHRENFASFLYSQ